jgi:hypothetical protein
MKQLPVGVEPQSGCAGPASVPAAPGPSTHSRVFVSLSSFLM